jgi:LPS sulfotransferase NodH
LASTGVLGRPESYFREPDEATWAASFGLEVKDARVVDYAAFAQAVRAAGTTANGVFAARVMWGSLARIMEGLAQRSGESDLKTLQRAFGPLSFVHLRRLDVVGQAVSWCRAEQTGFWQDGNDTAAAPRFDLAQLKGFVSTIGEHNAEWQRWFEHQGVRPLVISYEELVAHPRRTVDRVARLIRARLPADWKPEATQRKQADAINGEWAARLRASLGN